jgi:hypothetical protein
MAKKSKAPKPDENGILDTGIYRRSTRKLRGKEMAEPLMALATHTPLAEHLQRLRADLELCGDDDNPEIVRDAGQTLSWLAVVERELAKHKSGGYPLELLVRQAITLGMMCEKINVRPDEPLVLSERGRRLGAQEAIKTVNEAHDELRPQYQAAVDRQIESGQSYSAACGQVASSLGVSERTVRQHTVNLTPRNRGKWQR